VARAIPGFARRGTERLAAPSQPRALRLPAHALLLLAFAVWQPSGNRLSPANAPARQKQREPNRHAIQPAAGTCVRQRTAASGQLSRLYLLRAKLPHQSPPSGLVLCPRDLVMPYTVTSGDAGPARNRLL
jgi:hypothetical protein